MRLQCNLCLVIIIIRVFITQEITYFLAKNNLGCKIKKNAVHRTEDQYTVGDTVFRHHAWYIDQLLVIIFFGTHTQRNKTSLGHLLKISTEKPDVYVYRFLGHRWPGEVQLNASFILSPGPLLHTGR